MRGEEVYVGTTKHKESGNTHRGVRKMVETQRLLGRRAVIERRENRNCARVQLLRITRVRNRADGSHLRKAVLGLDEQQLREIRQAQGATRV